MQHARAHFIMYILILSLSIVPMRGCNRFPKGMVQNSDWWLMYRHNPQHTSYSSSKAPDSNQTLWVKQYGHWVRTSPAVHNNVVFIGTDDEVSSGAVHALNATTGAQIWSYITGGDVVSSTAAVYGRVYFGCDDWKFRCLNETTGNLLWSFQTGNKISSSPCVTEDRTVFGSQDHKFYCLDAFTGNHLWNFSTFEKVSSSPAVADGKVFFGSQDSKVYALNLISGTLIWSYTTMASVTVSPAVADGKVFISSYNTLYCLDVLDGNLIWNYTAGGPIHSSPAIAGGNIYFGCNDYKMYCLNAGNGQFKWTFTTKDIVYSSPAIADGKIFFGSNDKKVYCLNETTGILIWDYDTGGEIKTSSPAVADERVFVASNYFPSFSGRLFAFGVNDPPVASNLKIAPSSPLTTDSLIGSYDYYDEDGDLENGTEIRWFKNGMLQSGYNDVLEIPCTATTKGETWHFTVRPKDGEDFGELQISFSVIIQNTPPTIENVIITPDPAYTSDTLVANPIGWFDVDADPEGYFYQWQNYEETSGWRNITGATSQTLSHENFEKEFLMKILCIPYDDESHGDAREDTITISNSAPVIDSYYPLTNPTIAEGESQEFYITKSDADLDPLTVSWYLNDVDLEEESNSYVFWADYEAAGTYNATVVVSDDLSNAWHQWTLKVTDIERDIAITNLTLLKDLICQGYSIPINVTIMNQGELTETFNVTVYANTTAIEIFVNATLTSENATTITFSWDTLGLAEYEYYNITAYADCAPGEIDLTDNTFVDGIVIIVHVGDMNADGVVDISDLYAIALAYGTNLGEPGYEPNMDVNGDGTIDISDLYACALEYGWSG